MEISPELKQKIDEAMAKANEKRQPNMTIHQFLHRLNQYIAQLEKDKEKLINTGYNWENYVFFVALVAVLTKVHADRIAAEGKGPRQLFSQSMKKIKMYCKILILVTEHVIDRTDDSAVKAALKKIKKDTNNRDTLHDILALASILRNHLEIAKEFKPESMEVNEGYLDIVTKEAEDLLALEGKPITESSDRAMLVDKQERLITLCMDAIDEIKKYGEGAFCLHMDYYDAHYPLYLNQEKYSGNIDDETDIPDESETDSADLSENE